MAKTRVAPIKATTIARLELCAALLTARLLDTVAQDIHIAKDYLHAWTDSMVVLGWLKQDSTKFKVYVSNRISRPQDLVPSQQWRYVPTSMNPADVASRGTTPVDLIKHTLWWHGPPWLHQDVPFFPTHPTQNAADPSELRPSVLVISQALDDPPFWLRFSSWNWFVQSPFLGSEVPTSKCATTVRLIGVEPNLTSQEILATQRLLLKASQLEIFKRELTMLQKSYQLKGPLRKLTSFLDTDGVLRVGGRISLCSVSSLTLHPIILHHKSWITKLIVRHVHYTKFHPGPATLLTLLSNKYYIIGARSLVKSISRNCVICQRAYAKVSHQSMLPQDRVNPAPPFSKVGVDFAGPLMTVSGNPRKPTKVKSYACLFVCLVTKAVHIEICSELSLEAFPATFKRFCARRGYPTTVYSDNGRNFLGASRALKDAYNFITTAGIRKHLINFTSTQAVEWKFLPARTPHMGGLWESGVRAMKLHLKKVVGSRALTFEQLATVLTEAEAMLNSRPLLPLALDNGSVRQALTPGHFLIGRPILAPPHMGAQDSKIATLKRWKLITGLTSTLWRVWSGSYIQSLQDRSKWTTSQPNLKIGDIVLLCDETLPEDRNWPLGKITATYPGRDGLVRVVQLRSKGRIYKRAIHRLVKLPTEDPSLGREYVGDPASMGRQEVQRSGNP